MVTLAYLYIKDSAVSSILLLLLLLDFVLLGGSLPLLERKFLSLIQRRVGPNYIGYKGRFQFMADALKVFLKEYLYHAKINNVQYLTLPALYFSITMYFIYLFFFDSRTSLTDTTYSIIYFYILMMASNLVLFFSSLVTKNKYAILSGNRIALYLFSLDMFISIFLAFLMLICGSFDLGQVSELKFEGVISIHTLPLIPIIIVVFLIDANKAPFDLFEAESELVMGYSTEYGGFLFGLYVLTEYAHVYFFSFLIASMIL